MTVQGFSNFLTIPKKFFENDLPKGAKLIYIIAVEAIAVFRHIVPAGVSWFIQRYITRNLKVFPLQVGDTHGYLYLHGPLNKQQRCTPAILSHGDFSHPCTMLHIAKQLQSTNPVFSLYLPKIHDNTRFAANGQLIEQAIDQISAFVKEKGGSVEGIFAIGHSKAGMMFTERAFAADSSNRITKTCAIASPLDIEIGHRNDQEPLRSILKRIHQNVIQSPEKKLIQVIPDQDWNASFEIMAARPNQDCYTVPGMHTSGLYAKQVHEILNTI
jgi:hypothetical protein